LGTNDTSSSLSDHQNHSFTEPRLRENMNYINISSSAQILQQSLGYSNGPDDNFYYASRETQSDFRQVLYSGSAQQQYACQMCNFYSHNPKAIFSHINNDLHLNQGTSLPSPPSPAQHPWFHNSSSSIPHLSAEDSSRNTYEISSNFYHLD
jgi:hypothetical protein